MSDAALRGYPAERADLNVAVPPFNYNPSAWRQRIPICILALVAFVIATHMALYQWRLIDEPWDPVFGAQTRNVLDSDVALMMHGWFGIPDAALGAIAYLGDAIFGLAGSTRRWQYRPWLVILFGIDVIPLGIVSAILVICQATIVGNWCFLCLITAVISLILVYMAYDEVFASLKLLYRVWKQTRSTKTVFEVLCGKPSVIADEIASRMVRATA
jgi:uncharacterized membrane protein